jgi:protein TonB
MSDPESFNEDLETLNASFLHLHDNIPTPEQEPALAEADGFEGPRFPRLSQEEISKFRSTILEMEAGQDSNSTKSSAVKLPKKLPFIRRYRLELIAAVLLILLGIGGRHLYFEISGSREADELASAPEVEMKMMEIQPGLPSTDDESTEPAVTVKPPAAVSEIRIINDDIEIESDQVMERNEVSADSETVQERMPPLFPEDLKPKENKSMGYAVVEEDKKVTEVVTYIDGIAVGAEKKSTRRSNKQQSMADEEEVAEKEIFTVVETSPSFPGGDEARIRFLTNNISYPQKAREASVQGTVYITFVVERDGSISDVRVLRGIGAGCDEEAVRVIKMMPEWSPGKQRGKPVRVQFNMPIKFSLAE